MASVSKTGLQLRYDCEQGRTDADAAGGEVDEPEEDPLAQQLQREEHQAAEHQAENDRQKYLLRQLGAQIGDGQIQAI